MIKHLFKLMIWISAILMIGLIVSNARGRTNLTPASKIDYKIPDSYPRSKLNRARINGAFKAKFESYIIDEEAIVGSESLAREVLLSHPLSSDAIQTIASSRFLKNTEIEENTALLVTEALRRNGRNQQAIRLLMYKSLLADDIGGALKYIQDILVLNPSKTDSYGALIRTLYTVPQFQDVILNELSNYPLWSNSFLFELIPSLQEDELDIWRAPLTNFLQGHKHRDLKPHITRLYAARLFRLNRYDEAYKFVVSAYEAEASFVPSFVFNPEFNKIENVPFYSWALTNNADVIAEHDGNDGVFVSFNADKKSRILEQYSYASSSEPKKISFKYDFNADDKKGYFEWEFRCAASKELFFSHRLDQQSSGKGDNYISIPPRPADCEHLHTTLWGVPGVSARRFSMSLHSIDVSEDNL